MPRQSTRNSERAARLRESRQIEPTRLGTIAGAIAIAAAVVAYFATHASIINVMRNVGAINRAESTLSLYLVTLISGACLVAGGVGLLIRQTWGWWVALLGALIGLGGMFRLYAGLFAIIKPNHPRAAETAAEIVTYMIAPAALYAGVVALLAQRTIRENFRISSAQAPRRRGPRDNPEFDVR